MPLGFLFTVADLLGLGTLSYLVLRGSRQRYATCGQCGYIVEGLERMSCPECGGDFRQVGIVTSRQQGIIKPLVLIVLWLFLLPLPVLFATSQIVQGVAEDGWLTSQALAGFLLLFVIAVFFAGALLHFAIPKRPQNALSQPPQPPPGDGDAGT